MAKSKRTQLTGSGEFTPAMKALYASELQRLMADGMSYEEAHPHAFEAGRLFILPVRQANAARAREAKRLKREAKRPDQAAKRAQRKAEKAARKVKGNPL